MCNKDQEIGALMEKFWIESFQKILNKYNRRVSRIETGLLLDIVFEIYLKCKKIAKCSELSPSRSFGL